MKTKLFLEGIVPSEGLLISATPETFTKDGESKHYYKHITHTSVESLRDSVLAASDSGNHAFYAMASFKEESYTDATGKRKVRTQANVKNIRCLFLDIDCNGGDKNYDSQRDGLLGLHKFIKETGLPQPTYIVNSGGGIHVYWAFSKDIPVEKWQPVANKFKQLVAHLKLKADPVSADSARILRPIGTYNYKKKFSEPKPVTLLKDGKPYNFVDIAKIVLMCARSHNLQDTQVTPRKVDDANSALGGGLDEFPPSDADKIASKCQTLRAMRESKGADQSEIEWYNCLGILRHTEQGESICLTWSSGHPSYSQQATTEKLNQWGNLGPTTCATMRSACDTCDGCTLKCNSPIVLGFPDPEHQSEIIIQEPVEKAASTTESIADETEMTTVVESLPPIPEELEGKFAWVESKGLMAKIDDTDGNHIWVPICSQFPVPDFIFWDDFSESYMVRVKARVAPFSWLEGDISMDVVQKGGINLIGALGAKCAVTVTDEGKLLVKFMKTWVDSIRQSTELMSMCDQMGWQKDGTFLLGNKLYKKDGSVKDIVVSRSLTQYTSAHEPKGDINKFVEIIDKLYNKPNYESYQFFWLASFASPIIKFVHSHNVGITLSAWSKDSGTGKTSICKSGIANFGDPSGFGQTADGEGGATEYAMFTMAGLRHNLPILVDETTDWTPQKLGQFVYRFSNGTGKLQGKADGGLRDTAKFNWNSICYLTSNTPCSQSLMAHKRNCQAQLARVFDVKFNTMKFNTQDSVLFEELWQHTGNTGSKFISYVVKNQDKVKALNLKYLQHINDKAELTQEARFWAMFTSSVLTAAKITKVLGLHDFNIAELEAWTIKKLKQMRVISQSTLEEVDDTLRDLMAEMQSGMVVTYKEPTKRGDVTRFADGYGAPRNSVTGRYIVETGDIYVPVNIIRNWCAEQNVDMLDLRHKLENKKWLKGHDVRYDIGRGTNVASNRSRCWHINYEDAAKLLEIIQPTEVSA